MVRAVLYIFLTIIVLTFLRVMIGIIGRAFTEVVQQPSRPSSPARGGKQSEVPLSGELRRDPVCGTYVSTASSYKKSVGGEVLHFCTPECRDKYTA
ncbi:MAG: hypothetical protein ACK5AZ_10655 [Bryobacteraceae bacterium]